MYTHVYACIMYIIHTCTLYMYIHVHVWVYLVPFTVDIMVEYLARGLAKSIEEYIRVCTVLSIFTMLESCGAR